MNVFQLWFILINDENRYFEWLTPLFYLRIAFKKGKLINQTVLWKGWRFYIWPTKWFNYTVGEEVLFKYNFSRVTDRITLMQYHRQNRVGF